MDQENSTIHLLPTSVGTIIKKTKFGIWALFDGHKIFIHFSDTFTDPDTWDKDDEEEDLPISP